MMAACWRTDPAYPLSACLIDRATPVIEAGPCPGAIARALATFPADEHLITLLAAIHWWGEGPLGLGLMLAYRGSPSHVLAGLEQAGLTAHSKLVRTGLAYFGPGATTQAERAARWQDDTPLDAHLTRLSGEYAKLPVVIDHALARITTNPILMQRYDAYRAQAPAMVRLFALLDRLRRSFGDAPRYAFDWRAFQHWPSAPAQLLAIHLFHRHIQETGLLGFFQSEAGDIAPEIGQILRDWGLVDLATNVEAGIAHFPTPYPRDSRERWQILRSLGDVFAAIDGSDLLWAILEFFENRWSGYRGSRADHRRP